MRHRFIALTMVMVCWMPQTSGAIEPVAGDELFPVAAGNRWIYRLRGQDDRFVITALRKEKVGDTLCMRLEGKLNNRIVATEHVSITKEGVYRHRNDTAEIVPPLLICKFPPLKAESWKIDYKVDGKSASVAYLCDLEEVVVPAGKFNAVVIRAEVLSASMKIKNTCWYAANTGMVKQLIEDGDNKIVLELDKFEPAAPK